MTKPDVTEAWAITDETAAREFLKTYAQKVKRLGRDIMVKETLEGDFRWLFSEEIPAVPMAFEKIAMWSKLIAEMDWHAATSSKRRAINHG